MVVRWRFRALRCEVWGMKVGAHEKETWRKKRDIFQIHKCTLFWMRNNLFFIMLNICGRGGVEQGWWGWVEGYWNERTVRKKGWTLKKTVKDLSLLCAALGGWKDLFGVGVVGVGFWPCWCKLIIRGGQKGVIASSQNRHPDTKAFNANDSRGRNPVKCTQRKYCLSHSQRVYYCVVYVVSQRSHSDGRLQPAADQTVN